MSYKYKRRSWIEAIPVGVYVAVFALLLVSVFTVGPIAWSNTRNTYTITVDSKDRTMLSKGGSDQRIYTTNDQVFNVGDDWINGQWNSSDLYAKLQKGHTYTVETAGWRNGFFSQFPNIYKIQEEK